MSCLDDYTVDMLKEMSHDELNVLWDRRVDELKAEVVRAELIKQVEIRDGRVIKIGSNNNSVLGD